MPPDNLGSLLSGDEVVLVEARQHPMGLFSYARRSFLLLGLGLLLMALAAWLQPVGVVALLEILIELVTIVVVLSAVAWLPVETIRWLNRRFFLTSTRAMRVEGVLRQETRHTTLEQVSEVEARQSALGRLLGYADVRLITESGWADEYDHVVDGLEFKRAVMEAQAAVLQGAPLRSLPEGVALGGGPSAAVVVPAEPNGEGDAEAAAESEMETEAQPAIEAATESEEAAVTGQADAIGSALTPEAWLEVEAAAAAEAEAALAVGVEPASEPAPEPKPEPKPEPDSR